MQYRPNFAYDFIEYNNLLHQSNHALVLVEVDVGYGSGGAAESSNKAQF